MIKRHHTPNWRSLFQCLLKPVSSYYFCLWLITVNVRLKTGYFAQMLTVVFMFQSRWLPSATGNLSVCVKLSCGCKLNLEALGCSTRVSSLGYSAPPPPPSLYRLQTIRSVDHFFKLSCISCRRCPHARQLPEMTARRAFLVCSLHRPQFSIQSIAAYGRSYKLVSVCVFVCVCISPIHIHRSYLLNK